MAPKRGKKRKPDKLPEKGTNDESLTGAPEDVSQKGKTVGLKRQRTTEGAGAARTAIATATTAAGATVTGVVAAAGVGGAPEKMAVDAGAAMKKAGAVEPSDDEVMRVGAGGGAASGAGGGATATAAAASSRAATGIATAVAEDTSMEERRRSNEEKHRQPKKLGTCDNEGCPCDAVRTETDMFDANGKCKKKTCGHNKADHDATRSSGSRNDLVASGLTGTDGKVICEDILSKWRSDDRLTYAYGGPHPLAKRPFGDTVVSRKHSFNAAFDSFFELYRWRTEKRVPPPMRSISSSVTARVPAVATHSGRGGGKSRLIDELCRPTAHLNNWKPSKQSPPKSTAASIDDDPSKQSLRASRNSSSSFSGAADATTPVKCSPDPKSVLQFKREFGAALSVAVTFINGTGPVSTCPIDTGESALAHRILYGYFLADHRISYADFVKWSGRRIDLFDALKAISAHRCDDRLSDRSTYPALFVGVDELLTCPNWQDALSAVGRLMDAEPAHVKWRVYSMITSLDQYRLKELVATPTSQRPIQWIPLGPLQFRDVMARLFPAERENQSSKMLIAECGGHPRMLEVAADVIRANPIGDRAPAQHFTDLVNEMIRNATVKQYCTLADQPLSVLAAPLLGRRVRAIDMPDPRLKRTYSDLARENVYLNTFADRHSDEPVGEDSFVPRLNAIQLRHFARTCRTTESDSTLKEVATILDGMLLDEPNFGWEMLERFHFGWERLTRLLRPKQTVSVKDHYRLSQRPEWTDQKNGAQWTGYYDPQKWDPAKIHFVSDPKFEAVKLKQKFPRAVVPTDEAARVVDFRRPVCWLPARGTTGIDCCTVQPNERRTGLLPIAPQTKWTEHKSDFIRRDANDATTVVRARQHITESFAAAASIVVPKSKVRAWQSRQVNDWITTVFGDRPAAELKAIQQYTEKLTGPKLLALRPTGVVWPDVSSAAVGFFFECRDRLLVDWGFDEPILVYIAVRRAPCGLDADASSTAQNALTVDRIPDRTLLLFVDELRILYGPSLWSRPQFAFDGEVSE